MSYYSTYDKLMYDAWFFGVAYQEDEDNEPYIFNTCIDCGIISNCLVHG